MCSIRSTEVAARSKALPAMPVTHTKRDLSVAAGRVLISPLQDPSSASSVAGKGGLGAEPHTLSRDNGCCLLGLCRLAGDALLTEDEFGVDVQLLRDPASLVGSGDARAILPSAQRRSRVGVHPQLTERLGGIEVVELGRVRRGKRGTPVASCPLRDW